MRVPRALLQCCFAAALVATYGCGKNPDGAVVKIGHAAPLTGGQAHLGKDNENGVQLAIDDANAKEIVIGGKKVKFELLSEDDQADPKTGTIVAQKLVDAKVVGVIGHLNSGTSIPASKIYSDSGIPQISPSATSPRYTQQGYRTTFRVMANDVQQGAALGEFAANTLKAKTLAVIDDATSYGQGLADETEKAAKAAGATIITREHTTDKETDFNAVLTRIKSKSPDVIMFGGMDAQAGPMVKQMKELGIGAKFLGGDGVCSTEWAKNPDAEGEYCSQAGLPPEKMPAAADFVKRFTAKYGPIQDYAPYSYDATMALIEAIKKADSTDPAKILPELAKLSFDGITAKIEFDNHGDTKNGVITVFQIKNGQRQPLTTLGSGSFIASDSKPTQAGLGNPAKPDQAAPTK